MQLPTLTPTLARLPAAPGLPSLSRLIATIDAARGRLDYAGACNVRSMLEPWASIVARHSQGRGTIQGLTVADERALVASLAHAWQAQRRQARAARETAAREARAAAARGPGMVWRSAQSQVQVARTEAQRIAGDARASGILRAAGVDCTTLGIARWMRAHPGGGLAAWRAVAAEALQTADRVRAERQARRDRDVHRAVGSGRAAGALAEAARARRERAAERWRSLLTGAGVHGPHAELIADWLVRLPHADLAHMLSSVDADRADPSNPDHGGTAGTLSACGSSRVHAMRGGLRWVPWWMSEYDLGRLYTQPNTCRYPGDVALAVLLFCRAHVGGSAAHAAAHAAAAALRSDDRLRWRSDLRGFHWNGCRISRMRRMFGAPAGARGLDTAAAVVDASGAVVPAAPVLVSRDGYHAAGRRVSAALSLDRVGVEVEVCVLDQTRRNAGGRYLVPAGWRCEGDASITPREGEAAMEAISPPQPWAVTEAQVAAWHAALVAGGWRPRAGGSRGCGLHVTLSVVRGGAARLQRWLDRVFRASESAWMRVTGRASQTLHWADPRNREGKYRAVNPRDVMNRSGTLELVELRLWQGAIQRLGDFQGRLRASRLLQALAGWEGLDTATVAGDGLPAELPADIATEHAEAVAWWRARYTGQVATEVAASADAG